MRQYTPRRAGKRWLEGAPEYILDVFDQPKEMDRYTVFFGGSLLTRYEGQVYVHYWSGFGTGELKAHEAVAFRYGHSHHRIKWADLPKSTRKSIIRWATEDVQ